MEDKDVLQHLLEIEAQASVLVLDAQTEADRRIKAAEEQNRAYYDGEYCVLREKLEKEYNEKTAQVRAGYQRDLDAYRESLSSTPVNGEAFSRLAFSLLFGAK